jgi:hypothetical protein
MFAKKGVWIFASMMATTFALGTPTEANTLSNVSTRIIPNWNNEGAEVCILHNSNNVPVSALVSVFPMGTAVFGVDNWTFPILLGAFGSVRVFSWALPRRAGSCKVLSIQ